jgi:hypothetical protein
MASLGQNKSAFLPCAKYPLTWCTPDMVGKYCVELMGTDVPDEPNSLPDIINT